MKKYLCGFCVISVVVVAALWTGNTLAGLTATSMPNTFQDAKFPKRVEVKQTGYEPYKDASAYAIPNFMESDDEFKKQMCQRDREECCRRWPDYLGCQPSINYNLFGGDDTKCKDATDKSKGTGPDIYYTDRGATVSCVPTRNHSEFTGWCPDADRTKCGTPDCPMVHDIPVGSKDDKTFWACWDCIPPAKKYGDECRCADPNMDNACQCWGNMKPNPYNPDQCICKADASVAHIDYTTHQCVCNDSSLDINTNCTRTCPDPNMDPTDCRCLPVGSKNISDVCTCVDDTDAVDTNQKIVGPAPGSCECKDTTKMEKDANGRCKCIDASLDIDTNPLCKPDDYVMIQCRTNKDPARGFGTFNTINDAITALDCKTTSPRSIDDCFTPCDNMSAPMGEINIDLEPTLGRFCTGRWGSSMAVFEFRDYYDQTTVQKYDKATVNGALGRLTTIRYPSCNTRGLRYWFIFVYKIDQASGKYVYYIHKQIGA